MLKKISFLVLLPFLVACSVTTKITHNIIDKEVDFKDIRSSKWEVFVVDNIKTEAKGYANTFDVSKDKLLNEFSNTVERELKGVELEIGYRPVPEALKSEPTEKSKNDLLKFVKETKADYLFFISNVTATRETGVIDTPQGTQSMIGSHSKYEMIVNIWDVKNWKVVLSFGVMQIGNADLKKISQKAVDYILLDGKVESD